ncbi:glycosyltransferase [Dyadobacter arcticus]|uniref:Glycosyltransferase involved in cell wall biosynthesis n=1 Tax=Dyadobacter arcticus TaxID=1078754 RepID=A0ABX0UF74_9BACT|nr:glycosyltransferase [Dyadobacter arcticus]NIJ51567.1 glycosyltransferase involved in cell wall biosynthesis [Dyadobacter arcticus]
MDQPVVRKQIGLLFVSSYKYWAGGIIYMLNLIRALDLLNDNEKPELLIFYGAESPLDDVIDLNYPYIKYHQINSDKAIVKAYLKFKRILTRKSAFFSLLPEIVYPYNKHFFLGKKPINWIPDFQEWYLPQMFSEDLIRKRKMGQREIADGGGVVVFSSNDAMNDFKKFFPDHKCELRLLKFASILPDFSYLNIKDICGKYDIEGRYFMSPNQFWVHKNHTVIFEAIALLKQDNLDFSIVFTGSQTDYRNAEYFEKLKDFIAKNQIEKWIKFLGFIDRAEQLCLMANAEAIVQPSLFEGWSTVVEDTKAMNQYILLSDIPVHREQINKNCHFFDPTSPAQLAALIKENVLSKPQIERTDYSRNIREFAYTVLNVLQH